MRASLFREARGEFISLDGLQHLSDYQYSGEDKSLLYKYVVLPSAKCLCSILPKFIAPNVLTLLGLFCTIAAYILLACWAPTLCEAAPRWTYFVAGALVLLYLLLDASDGVQARITGMASPLGELLDHVCDSFSLTLCSLLFCITCRLGIPASCAVLIACWVPFYLSHYDSYNTGKDDFTIGKLIMGRFGGPTDVLVILVCLLFLTGVKPDVWLYTLSRNVDLRTPLVVVLITGSIISAIQYTTHVFRHRKEKTHSGVGYVGQLVPFAFFCLVCILWQVLTPNLIYPHQAFITEGLILAYLLSRCIVQRIASEPAKYFYVILVPFFLAFLMSFLSSSPLLPWHNNPIAAPLNFVLVYGLLILAFVQWIYFFASAVTQIAKYLEIPVFTVPKEKRSSVSGEKSRLLPHPHEEHAGTSGKAAR